MKPHVRREENYQLYHSTLEQMAVVQSTLQSVTQQRDELRQLHKVCYTRFLFVLI